MKLIRFPFLIAFVFISLRAASMSAVSQNGPYCDTLILKDGQALVVQIASRYADYLLVKPCDRLQETPRRIRKDYIQEIRKNSLNEQEMRKKSSKANDRAYKSGVIAGSLSLLSLLMNAVFSDAVFPIWILMGLIIFTAFLIALISIIAGRNRPQKKRGLRGLALAHFSLLVYAISVIFFSPAE